MVHVQARRHVYRPQNTFYEGYIVGKVDILKMMIHIVPYYLLEVTNPSHRVALAQYRLSSPNLGIETGRHTKPPKPQEQCLCLYCRNGCIDDEIHFLTECDMLSYSILSNGVQSSVSYTLVQFAASFALLML